jgi:hypothetical protein
MGGVSVPECIEDVGGDCQPIFLQAQFIAQHVGAIPDVVEPGEMRQIGERWNGFHNHREEDATGYDGGWIST